MQATKPVALFLFAHQDDEFGVFQLIANAVLRGHRVICVYLTGGKADGSQCLHRNAESLAVLGRLGVTESNVIFAGHQLTIPDGQLPEHLIAATSWVRDLLSELPDETMIYVPAWEGGHHDHDALHAIACIVAGRTSRLASVRQFSLYNAFRCKGPLFRVFLALQANGQPERMNISWPDRVRFARFCLSYPSQAVTWIGLFPFVLLHYVVNGCQEIQAVNLERISERPHEGPLYYERRGFSTWEKMSSRISKLQTHENQ